MAHNFFKQSDGSIICSWCGDVKKVDVERACPKTEVAGGLKVTSHFNHVVLFVPH